MLEHTRHLVERFEPAADERAAESRRRISALLDKGAAVFRRDHFDPGHVTASGIVLRTHEGPREVLLVFHKRLERWLQPGGHIEATDTDVIAAARREVLEETGVTVEGTVELVGLDVHPIPAGRGEPAHLHHDLVFGFHAATTALRPSEESREVRWCGVDRLVELKPDAALVSAVRRALRD